MTVKFEYFIFPFAVIISVLIINKIIFNLFMNHPSEYHLTREKFEQSLKQSKDAITSIKMEGIHPYIYVENKEINVLISKIINKSTDLLNDSGLDNQDRYIAHKSVSNYMPKVIATYKNINPAIRNIKGDNESSAHDMTVEQLKTIFSGLEEIELNSLAQKHDNLKVNKYFLNNVFDK